VRDTYARYARSVRKQRAWRADNVGNQAIKDEVATHLLALAGARLGEGDVLDMGCGTGWWLERMRCAGADPERLHGVDLVPDRVRAAGERLPGARLAIADVRSLPFEAGRFSLVTLLLVLSSLHDRDAMHVALDEARRVTAAKGLVAVWEPRVANPLNRATHHVPEPLVADVLGPAKARVPLTLLPALARQLRTPQRYASFARVSALRTHRLTVHEPHPALDS
jgi:ubiquinone/menaquinone biosynthesis C-methylase UbiE